MFPHEKFNIPGEHPFFFSGLVGQLEAVLTVPEEADLRRIALIGHPHSLQGGTMNNKVVTTLVRACKELKIPSIRFNFRGVGHSEGAYDAGVGESEDMLVLKGLCQQAFGKELQFIFAGFSFGSYVAYRAAAHSEQASLISIAPPVHHYDYQEFTPPSPWVIIHGDEDEVVPVDLVLEFAKQFSPPLPLYRFAETSHFFHGKLLALKEKLLEVLKTEAKS